MTSLYASEVLDRLTRNSVSVRQVRDAQRHGNKLLLRRAQFLPEQDQRLLRLALKYRLSIREIATLIGCNHGSVVRRLRRLQQRLCDPIVVALVDRFCPLGSQDREMALDYFLRSRPLCEIARCSGLPPREVRRRILYVKGWASGRKEGARATRAVLIG